MTLRVLVPDEALADAIAAHGVDRHGTDVQAQVWHIDDPGDPPDAEVLVTARPADPAHRARVAAIPSLQHVRLLSLGYDWIVDHLPAGVVLSISRGAVEGSTAELGVGLVIAALRRFHEAAAHQHRGQWQMLWTSSLLGSTVLLLGYGGVGEQVAARLRSFEPARIIPVASRARTRADGVRVHGADELPELLPLANVVVVSLPGSPETAGTVDAAFLARMRDGAALVNIGRGQVVDSQALLAELRAGRLAAALDVVDPEPLPAGDPLWSAPNCLITPHIGGNTTEFVRRSTAGVLTLLDRLTAGEAPPHVVDLGAR